MFPRTVWPSTRLWVTENGSRNTLLTVAAADDEAFAPSIAVASTRKVCDPFAKAVVSRDSVYGAVVSVAIDLPSTLNETAEAVLPDGSADHGVVPVNSAPAFMLDPTAKVGVEPDGNSAATSS
jgi:hypothetical protein